MLVGVESTGALVMIQDSQWVSAGMSRLRTLYPNRASYWAGGSPIRKECVLVCGCDSPNDGAHLIILGSVFFLSKEVFCVVLFVWL